jgi:soluble lytic murein transglycosylase
MRVSQSLRLTIVTAAFCLGLGASSAGLIHATSEASAQTEAASLTVLPAPAPPSATEVMRLRDGLAAYAAEDWTGLAALRDRAADPLVRRMLQWLLATAEDAPLDFDSLSDALRTLQGWPGRAGMRARAERAIFTSRLSPADRIAFLREDGGPKTGDGRVALAQALRQASRRSEAEELVRAAWREDDLSPLAAGIATSEFSSALTQQDYADRVAILLWRGDRTDAEALLSRIGPADRALAHARIALQVRQRRGLQAAVDAVPASRRNDPGLLYDRARYVRRSGRPQDAMPIAAQIDPRAAPLAARDDIFEERRLYVPRALRAGSTRLAYNLVSNHGLTSGESFADAEWLSGWIALRFTRDPARAAEHFTHLSANVSAPVSQARALYWRAQAARALGQAAEADARLAEAARFEFTYYGQLAASRRGQTAYFTLPARIEISREARVRFESRELVRALRLMSQVGSRADFESIAYFLDDTLEDPQEVELLSQIARESAYSRTALRHGKAGLFRGVVAVNAAYPLIPLPSSVNAPGRPEQALVLAIIRQESEFDSSVVSHAGARGLMQLMPATARLTARSEGIAYQAASLTADPNYNVTLGAAHLGSLIQDFNGSYVLAIASYNAGSMRAREWIADWGDPRSPSVDVVDWVELIPFAETRNYVQRVMENVQVYRYRLADGRQTPITLDQDLRRGR